MNLRFGRQNVTGLFSVCSASLLICFCLPSAAAEPILSIKQLMNGIVTPATNTIWGAYQLDTPAQWQEVEEAAIAVIAAGNLMQSGGADKGEKAVAEQQLWQNYTQQMISAASNVLTAVEQRNESVLSQVGNDELYPPCESCHQEYQNK
ncbi:MAG: hypothetical protein AB8B95_12205 [Pseudohongiellaceae bacterium]